MDEPTSEVSVVPFLFCFFSDFFLWSLIFFCACYFVFFPKGFELASTRGLIKVQMLRQVVWGGAPKWIFLPSPLVIPWAALLVTEGHKWETWIRLWSSCLSDSLIPEVKLLGFQLVVGRVSLETPCCSWAWALISFLSPHLPFNEYSDFEISTNVFKSIANSVLAYLPAFSFLLYFQSGNSLFFVISFRLLSGFF